MFGLHCSVFYGPAAFVLGSGRVSLVRRWGWGQKPVSYAWGHRVDPADPKIGVKSARFGWIKTRATVRQILKCSNK